MNSTYPYKVLGIVAETGKITAAAELLNLTPSAVSHTIQGLEKELGFDVFKRSRNGVSLTENGKRILPHIYSVIREQDALEQRSRNIVGMLEGSIRIGGFYSVTMNWLIDIFKDFRSKYPDIQIEFLEGGYKDISRWIDQNLVDIAFASRSMIGDRNFIPLANDEILCVLPEDYPLDPDGAMTTDMLRKANLVLQEDGEDADIKSYLLRYMGDYSHSHFIIEDDNCIMAMVEAGFGVALIGRMGCNRRIANVKTASLKPKLYRSIGIHIPNEKSMSPATEKMRDCIIDYVSASCCKLP